MSKYYLDIDSPYEVVAFCVNDDLDNNAEFEGLPVVQLLNIEKKYSTFEFSFFAKKRFPIENTTR